VPRSIDQSTRFVPNGCVRLIVVGKGSATVSDLDLMIYRHAMNIPAAIVAHDQ